MSFNLNIFYPSLKATLIGIALVFCCSTLTYAQDDKEYLDSLYVNAKAALFEYNYGLSIDRASQLIKEAELGENYNYMFHGYNILSFNYYQLRDSLPAFEYARKALSQAKKAKNDSLLAWGYNNLGRDLSENPETRAEALSFLNQAVLLYEKASPDSYNVAAINLAELYGNIREYDMMKAYLEKAEDSYKPSGDEYDYYKTGLLIVWGDYYNGVEGFETANEYYKKAYKSIKKNQFGQMGLEFLNKYSSFLANQDMHQDAYLVSQVYQKLFEKTEKRISEGNVQIAKANADAEEFKRQRNEAELKRALSNQKLSQQKSEIILLSIISFILLLFIVYTFIAKKTRKRLIKDLQVKNQELSKANHKVKESVRAKSKFFSTLSHEMRTPLYGVTGIVKLLENDTHLKSHKEELNSLKFSANHLLDIINDLLDISKLEEKEFKLINRPFNIRQLLEEIVGSFDQYNSLNQCEVHLDIDDKIPTYVMGDSRRLSQILLNIIGNGIKFTQQGDIWIKLNSTSQGNGNYAIHFSIKDNGIGISDQDQEIIFNEFSQIDKIKGSPSLPKGTGLGLPIVKKLLERMGSTIHLESTLNEGSEFSFLIDFKEATLLDVMEYGTGQEDTKNKEQLRIIRNSSILIVDDNKINRLVTKKVLDQRGVHVTEATSGQEALKKIEKGGIYDLILMDVHMPVLDGFETTRRIRKIDQNIPILALTAADSEFVNREIKKSGMDGVIIKPYNMQEFLGIIVKHLSIRKTIATI